MRIHKMLPSCTGRCEPHLTQQAGVAGHIWKEKPSDRSVTRTQLCIRTGKLSAALTEMLSGAWCTGRRGLL